jgi:serine/threonine protein kinase
VEPGTILQGKYRVDEVLGTGGMGKVVRASHLYLQQPVAIKILLEHMAENAETVSRFLREAQASSRLRSEHIAKVTDVGTLEGDAKVPYMVMEYLEGNDLNQILRHHGPQLPQVVCDLILQACEGIAEAHAQGIVHRDIKPSNFFITRRSDGSMLLKILDFGISKTPVNITELTGTQTVIGTPTYMSPEQMKSGKAADQRSDIWSMGIVMYQMLAGRPPFSGESYAELVIKVSSEPPTPMHVQLPHGLGEVILRCLEKNPTMRHQNVAELARSIAPFASDPIQAAQSAARTTRILQQRNSVAGIGVTPLTSNGGRLAPVPISPAQLTPRSWPPSSSPSSLSHGRGQVTHQVRSSKGWIIAGVLSLCIAAGAGGYIASEMNRDDDELAATRVTAPPPQEPPPTTSGVTTLDRDGKTQTPVEAKPVEDKQPVETKVVDTKPVETKVVDKKPVEKKPVETKAVVKKKPAVVKKKLVKKKSSGDDELFDSRK